MPFRFRFNPCTVSAFLVATMLCSCQTIKKITPDWNLPKPGLPKLSKVKKMIPGLDDGLPADDPKVPFNANGTLGYGHSIAMDVYEGVRNPKRLFEGKRMVDENGVISFGKTGSAKVGGRSLVEAERLISSVFRVGGRSSFALTVHLPMIEGVELVRVDGDVVGPVYVPMWERMHLRDLVQLAGGRKAGSTARSLYITRDGQKMFFPNIEAAETWWKFRAGDIVTLSPDL